MVFSATFNNISVISWRSIALLEENLSYIVAVNCIAGGNRRKPPTFRKSLTNFNKYSNMAFFFRLADKRAIYRWYNLIRTCAGECD